MPADIRWIYLHMIEEYARQQWPCRLDPREHRRRHPRLRKRSLHYWVFGGPWSSEEEPRGEPTGADKKFLDEGIARCGAIVGGRNTYEAAGAWGGHNPFGVPFFIVTHHPEDGLADAGFTFVNGLDEAVARAREEAGSKDVFVMGGADVIRQALRDGHVEELTISIAPVVLGGGKRRSTTSRRR